MRTKCSIALDPNPISIGYLNFPRKKFDFRFCKRTSASYSTRSDVHICHLTPENRSTFHVDEQSRLALDRVKSIMYPMGYPELI